MKVEAVKVEAVKGSVPFTLSLLFKKGTDPFTLYCEKGTDPFTYLLFTAKRVLTRMALS